MYKKVKFVEVKSEIGAGTRGASLGVDAIKIAALDYGSSLFKRVESVEIENENHLLFEAVGSPYAKRIKGILNLYEKVGKEVADTIRGNGFPVVLAGDHSTAGGTIAGIKMAYPKQRLGAIWIPERYPWARLGLAYHSGVNFYCTDNYFADMTTQFTGANYQYSSPINELNYYIRTPRKWQLNTAFNVGDRWLLAGDVEQQDFRKGNIEGAGSNTYGYQSENSLIEEQGNLCTRLRLGVEFRAIGPLRLRAGWDYQSAPYAQMQALQQFHAGIGVRAERFFIDASLSLGGQQQTWYMYDSRLVAAAQIHTFQTSGRLSVGWRLSDFHQQEDPQELTPKGSGTGDF